MKKAQSELVGFALIVVIVTVIILVFLVSSYNSSKKEGEVSSPETDSFLNSILQYTTNCTKRGAYLDVRGLIDECKYNFVCEENKKSCLVLNETLDPLIDASWDTSNGSLVKGYDFAIIVDAGLQSQKTLYTTSKGQVTNLIRGSTEKYDSGAKQVFFTVYY